MSVVGFDLGNSASVVALAQKRGIDVLLNTEAKRETPSVVFFGDNVRSMGAVAASKQTMYPKNTVTQLKRLIGKKFQSPEVQSDLKKFPFSIVEGPDGDCLITVQFGGQLTVFAPEQLIAMTLVDLKKIVFSNTSIGVTDCVVSVPGYFTEKERHGMLDACRIAGLNCLRLMDDTAAVALAYGIFKSDLPEDNPLYVVFVDMGHSSLQVCIVALKKGQLRILSSCWDRNLGGRDYDEVLFHHFAAEFKQKMKLDVLKNDKACFRLRTNCEKTKKILSANSQAALNVECLMEDTDFSSKIDRDTFEELTEHLTARVLPPCEGALAEAGITIDKIASVEVVGSSSRIPAVQRVIEGFFKKPISRTLNAKECIARGCALQCAMLSPVFKVKEFEITNCQPYAINFSWEKDGETKVTPVFKRTDPYPLTKEIPFFRSEPFFIHASYAEDQQLLSPYENKDIGKFEIGPFVIPEGTEKANLKLRVRINGHGLLEVESVYSYTKEEEEVPVPESKEENPVSEEANGGDKSAPVEKKVKTRKTNVPFTIQKDTGLSIAILNDYFEKEGKMAAEDRLFEETQEKKNAVESYVYELRNRLSGDLVEFVSEADKSKILTKLEDTEDWLYEDGENQTKSVYVAKLEELRKFGDPIELRFHEFEARPKAAQYLQHMCENYIAMATTDSEEYNHIEEAEKNKVISECEKARVWLVEKLKMQDLMQKTDTPCILSTEIQKKQDVVDRFCRQIMSTPKPKPKSKKEKQEEEKPTTEPQEEPASAQGEAEEKTPQEDNDAMDTTE
eukprot:g1266.t1